MSPSGRRAVRTLLRRAVYPAIESTWAAAFGAAGRLTALGRATPRWTACGRARVAIVSPHPDDETIGCGGVACLHRAAGDRVSALILTDGALSRAGSLAPAERMARRAAEARAASAALGLTSTVLAGLPEGSWEHDNGVHLIAEWLAREHPILVYAPSCVDFHPEHVRVSRALSAALQTLPSNDRPAVRVYEVFVPLGPALVNCVADIAPVRAVKVEALGCYASQREGLAQVARRDRYLARFYGLESAAEGFCAMSAAGYSALVTAGDWTGRVGPFRGLRGRPFSDPLAYIIGGRTRSSLRRMRLDEP